jgi:large subunit ribosomal protein L17
MRKNKKNRVFGREVGVRTAMLKSLARSLVLKDKIKTTEAKAKEIRPIVEKLVTKAKDGSIASRRIIAARVGEGSPTEKLMTVLAPKYKTRAGGYTRIVKLGRRLSDGAAMAQIEFVS